VHRASFRFNEVSFTFDTPARLYLVRGRIIFFTARNNIFNEKLRRASLVLFRMYIMQSVARAQRRCN